MIDQVTTSYTGQIQIFKANYLKDRLIQNSFDPPTAALRAILPPGSVWTNRVHLPALASSGDQSSPILLQGIDPENEAQITKIRSNLVKGQYLEADLTPDCNSRQAYIGQELADLLSLDIGDKLIVLAQSADGSLGHELFRVRGTFKSNSADMDRSFVFAPLACVTKIGSVQGVHEVAIRLPPDADSPKIKSTLAQSIDSILKVTDWRETLPGLNGMLKFNDALLLVISFILFVVITLGVVNTLLIGVFERTREFGVMIALGSTPNQVRGMMILESLLLAAASTVLGTLMGSALVLYHRAHGFSLQPFLGERSFVGNIDLQMVIYPSFSFRSFIEAVCVTILFIVLASLYPAYRASKLNPVTAMKAL